MFPPSPTSSSPPAPSPSPSPSSLPLPLLPSLPLDEYFRHSLFPFCPPTNQNDKNKSKYNNQIDRCDPLSFLPNGGDPQQYLKFFPTAFAYNSPPLFGFSQPSSLPPLPPSSHSSNFIPFPLSSPFYSDHSNFALRLFLSSQLYRKILNTLYAFVGKYDNIHHGEQKGNDVSSLFSSSFPSTLPSFRQDKDTLIHFIRLLDLITHLIIPKEIQQFTIPKKFSMPNTTSPITSNSFASSTYPTPSPPTPAPFISTLSLLMHQCVLWYLDDRLRWENNNNVGRIMMRWKFIEEGEEEKGEKSLLSLHDDPITPPDVSQIWSKRLSKYVHPLGNNGLKTVNIGGGLHVSANPIDANASQYSALPGRGKWGRGRGGMRGGRGGMAIAHNEQLSFGTPSSSSLLSSSSQPNNKYKFGLSFNDSDPLTHETVSIIHEADDNDIDNNDNDRDGIHTDDDDDDDRVPQSNFTFSSNLTSPSFSSPFPPFPNSSSSPTSLLSLEDVDNIMELPSGTIEFGILLPPHPTSSPLDPYPSLQLTSHHSYYTTPIPMSTILSLLTLPSVSSYFTPYAAPQYDTESLSAYYRYESSPSHRYDTIYITLPRRLLPRITLSSLRHYLSTLIDANYNDPTLYQITVMYDEYKGNMGNVGAAAPFALSPNGNDTLWKIFSDADRHVGVSHLNDINMLRNGNHKEKKKKDGDEGLQASTSASASINLAAATSAGAFGGGGGGFGFGGAVAAAPLGGIGNVNNTQNMSPYCCSKYLFIVNKNPLSQLALSLPPPPLSALVSSVSSTPSSVFDPYTNTTMTTGQINVRGGMFGGALPSSIQNPNQIHEENDFGDHLTDSEIVGIKNDPIDLYSFLCSHSHHPMVIFKYILSNPWMFQVEFKRKIPCLPHSSPSIPYFLHVMTVSIMHLIWAKVTYQYVLMVEKQRKKDKKIKMKREKEMEKEKDTEKKDKEKKKEKENPNVKKMNQMPFGGLSSSSSSSWSSSSAFSSSSSFPSSSSSSSSFDFGHAPMMSTSTPITSKNVYGGGALSGGAFGTFGSSTPIPSTSGFGSNQVSFGSSTPSSLSSPSFGFGNAHAVSSFTSNLPPSSGSNWGPLPSTYPNLPHSTFDPSSFPPPSASNPFSAPFSSSFSSSSLGGTWGANSYSPMISPNISSASSPSSDPYASAPALFPFPPLTPLIFHTILTSDPSFRSLCSLIGYSFDEWSEQWKQWEFKTTWERWEMDKGNPKEPESERGHDNIPKATGEEKEKEQKENSFGFTQTVSPLVDDVKVNINVKFPSVSVSIDPPFFSSSSSSSQQHVPFPYKILRYPFILNTHEYLPYYHDSNETHIDINDHDDVSLISQQVDPSATSSVSSYGMSNVVFLSAPLNYRPPSRLSPSSLEGFPFSSLHLITPHATALSSLLSPYYLDNDTTSIVISYIYSPLILLLSDISYQVFLSKYSSNLSFSILNQGMDVARGMSEHTIRHLERDIGHEIYEEERDEEDEKEKDNLHERANRLTNRHSSPHSYRISSDVLSLLRYSTHLFLPPLCSKPIPSAAIVSSPPLLSPYETLFRSSPHFPFFWVMTSSPLCHYIQQNIIRQNNAFHGQSAFGGFAGGSNSTVSGNELSTFFSPRADYEVHTAIPFPYHSSMVIHHTLSYVYCMDLSPNDSIPRSPHVTLVYYHYTHMLQCINMGVKYLINNGNYRRYCQLVHKMWRFCHYLNDDKEWSKEVLGMTIKMLKRGRRRRQRENQRKGEDSEKNLDMGNGHGNVNNIAHASSDLVGKPEVKKKESPPKVIPFSSSAAPSSVPSLSSLSLFSSSPKLPSSSSSSSSFKLPWIPSLAPSPSFGFQWKWNSKAKSKGKGKENGISGEGKEQQNETTSEDHDENEGSGGEDDDDNDDDNDRDDEKNGDDEISSNVSMIITPPSQPSSSFSPPVPNQAASISSLSFSSTVPSTLSNFQPILSSPQRITPPPPSHPVPIFPFFTEYSQHLRRKQVRMAVQQHLATLGKTVESEEEEGEREKGMKTFGGKEGKETGKEKDSSSLEFPAVSPPPLAFSSSPFPQGFGVAPPSPLSNLGLSLSVYYHFALFSPLINNDANQKYQQDSETKIFKGLKSKGKGLGNSKNGMESESDGSDSSDNDENGEEFYDDIDESPSTSPENTNDITWLYQMIFPSVGPSTKCEKYRSQLRYLLYLEERDIRDEIRKGNGVVLQKSNDRQHHSSFSSFSSLSSSSSPPRLHQLDMESIPLLKSDILSEWKRKFPDLFPVFETECLERQKRITDWKELRRMYSKEKKKQRKGKGNFGKHMVNMESAFPPSSSLLISSNGLLPPQFLPIASAFDISLSQYSTIPDPNLPLPYHGALPSTNMLLFGNDQSNVRPMRKPKK